MGRVVNYDILSLDVFCFMKSCKDDLMGNTSRFHIFSNVTKPTDDPKNISVQKENSESCWKISSPVFPTKLTPHFKRSRNHSIRKVLSTNTKSDFVQDGNSMAIMLFILRE